MASLVFHNDTARPDCWQSGHWGRTIRVHEETPPECPKTAKGHATGRAAVVVFYPAKATGRFALSSPAHIGPYIADFVCVDVKLVVELDGGQHTEGDAPLRDAERDACMEKQGFAVLRFWNSDVFTNIEGVLDKILFVAEELRSEKGR